MSRADVSEVYVLESAFLLETITLTQQEVHLNILGNPAKYFFVVMSLTGLHTGESNIESLKVNCWQVKCFTQFA